MPRGLPTCRIAFAVLAAALTSCPQVRATNPDVQFVDELADRGLYRLVDEFCRQQFSATERSSRKFAELAAAWVRIKGRQAMEAPPQRQSAVWVELNEIMQAAADKSPDNQFVVLIDLEAALTELLRGRLIRENATVGSGPVQGAGAAASGPEFEDARQSIRAAIGQLDDAASSVEALLAEAYRQRNAVDQANGWTTRELESLRREIALKRAEAYREQALCYPSDSPDRVNSLSLALETLTQLASLDDADAQLAWHARINQVRCLRLLGRYQQAEAQISRWLDGQPPASSTGNLTAEQIRIFLDRGEARRALKAAIDAASSGEKFVPTPDFDDAALEALIGARDVAAADQRGELLDRAVQLSRQIAVRHGRYWHRRAEARLGQALSDADNASDDPDLLLAAAKNLYAGGRHRKAIEQYDRIAELQASAGNANGAFDAASTAAAIVAENGEISEAVARRIRLAQRFPEHPAAAEIHLAAVAGAAETARQALAAEQSDRLQQYLKLLRQQFDVWPDAPATQKARLWRARYDMSLQQWDAALEQLQRITHANPSYDEAIQETLKCYWAKLDNPNFADGVPSAVKQRADLVAAATNRLNAVIAGDQNRLPQSWSPLQRRVALELASMQLQYFEEVHPYTLRILQALSAITNAGKESWARRASALQAAAEARRGKVSVAEDRLRQSTAAPAHVLEMLACLRLDSSNAGEEEGRDDQALGQFAVTAIQLAEKSGMSPTDEAVSQLRRYEASALAVAGNRSSAVDAYRALVERHPHDGDLAVALAELLATGSREEMSEALDSFRRIEDRSRAGGTRWRRARHARIELLSRLGRQEQADRLARLTRVIYRDFDAGPTLDDSAKQRP